jgi:hypothetical protein
VDGEKASGGGTVRCHLVRTGRLCVWRMGQSLEERNLLETGFVSMVEVVMNEKKQPENNLIEAVVETAGEVGIDWVWDAIGGIGEALGDAPWDL